MPQPLMWNSEDNFREPVLSFHLMGPGDRKLLDLTAAP